VDLLDFLRRNRSPPKDFSSPAIKCQDLQFFFVSLSNAERKMRSPHTTGDEWPDGIAAVQTMCLPGPNSIGGFSDGAAIPVPDGPRNWGHDGTSAARVQIDSSAAIVTPPAPKLCSCLPC